MKRYIAYLRYVVRHRWFVMIACFQHGMFWRGLVHDLSKFRPSEFIPYAHHFYNRDGSKRDVRDKTGYYKPTDTGDSAFDMAWFKHQKRNRHHWQWWIMPTSAGEGQVIKILEMPDVYVREMVCDWIGAGLAQGHGHDVRPWYEKNKGKMRLHPDTRAYVRELLEHLSDPWT